MAKVVGEVEDSSIDYQVGCERLRDSVRMASGEQLTRRSVHGFYIHQTTNDLELWIFDRAGQFLLESLNISKDHFISIAKAFLLMGNSEVGMDTFMQHDALAPYISFDESNRLRGSRRINHFTRGLVSGHRAQTCVLAAISCNFARRF